MACTLADGIYNEPQEGIRVNIALHEVQGICMQGLHRLDQVVAIEMQPVQSFKA